MATPRKRRPSFDAPTPAPEAKAWAYRTDPTEPAAAPAPPVRTVSSPPSSTPSVLNRIVTTPVMLTALIVLLPLSLLTRRAKPR